MSIPFLITAASGLLALGVARAAGPEAERAAIQRTAAEHAKAASAGGAEGAHGYAAYATADARWHPPESPALSGREAIARWASPFTNMPGFQVTWEHPHVVVARSSDIAYSVGTYRGTWRDAQGNTQVSEGKLLSVWRKEPDGSWKVVVASWNTNQPVAPAPATP